MELEMPEWVEAPPGDENNYGADGTSYQPEPSEQDDPVAALMAEFNSRYMVVCEAGKAMIYEPAYDLALKRRFHTRITFEDFKKLYLNRYIKVGKNQDGAPIRKPAATVWLNHSDRRQYIGGVTFDPSGKHARPDELNLWKGFDIEPKPGSWVGLRGHIFRIICGGNREYFEFLMCWMSRLIQNPGDAAEVAVVLRGIEGAGKGILAKALLRLLGQHGLAISNSKHLTGNFNGHLRDCIFLFADEAFFAGDVAHVGVLKSIITEPFLTVEAKFQNAVPVPNRLHLMMSSNEAWVVPAGLEARRFLVLDVLPDRANDHEYFGGIMAEMEAGGYAAMLHDLMARDLSRFNPRAVPITDGLNDQKKLSVGTSHGWWLDCLYRGYVYKSKLGLEAHFGEWHDWMSTDVLYSSYEAFADARRERRRMSREAMGKFLASVGPEPARRVNAVIGEHLADVTNAYGGTARQPAPIIKARGHGYALGSLSVAREAFCKATGLSAAWPEDADYEAPA